MTPDLVILDLDGTLLDTRWRHHACYTHVVEVMGGSPQPLAGFWRAKRRPTAWPQLLERSFGRRLSEQELVKFFAAWQGSIESDALLLLDRLHPGVTRALGRLRERGLRAFLVTARRNEAALGSQLKRLGLHEAFEAVIISAGDQKHAAVRSAAACASIVGWIGDTEDDVVAARALGVPVAVVTNGIRGRAHLAELRPDSLVRSVAPAVEFLIGRLDAQL